MKKITNIWNYEGHYDNEDGSFSIMVDEGNDFVIYYMIPGRDAKEQSRFVKAGLDNAKDFPEAVGKFIPELIRIFTPIEINQVPDFDDTKVLINKYLEQYGASF